MVDTLNITITDKDGTWKSDVIGLDWYIKEEFIQEPIGTVMNVHFGTSNDIEYFYSRIKSNQAFEALPVMVRLPDYSNSGKCYHIKNCKDSMVVIIRQDKRNESKDIQTDSNECLDIIKIEPEIVIKQLTNTNIALNIKLERHYGLLEYSEYRRQIQRVKEMLGIGNTNKSVETGDKGDIDSLSNRDNTNQKQCNTWEEFFNSIDN